ncbi:MAG: hypothetical protein KDC47_04335 [Flavobacteriaceae bacterium]|nr:hypothetical protein [Flavobacteriaceae bacterium]
MKDNLEQKFKELEGKFDVEEPMLGHFDRFKVRLAKDVIENEKPKQSFHTWKWLSIAASVILLVGIWIGSNTAKPGLELAEVSPEMQETQNFFVSTIQTELEQIKLKRNDDNKQVIDDALNQLHKLEENYKQLTVELQKSNEDRRVIYAMISNFQQRIEVLQNLLQQLNELEQLKLNNDEKVI